MVWSRKLGGKEETKIVAQHSRMKAITAAHPIKSEKPSIHAEHAERVGLLTARWIE
jgi:hypothetical protein